MSAKKCLSFVLLSLLLIAVMGCSDSDADLGPISHGDIANEKPLTQSDIDAYIAILPEIAPVEHVDGQAAAAIYKKYGLSRLRYKYIKTKIPFCAGMNAGRTYDFSKVPASMKPNEAELSLVNANLDAIDAAHQLYRQKVVNK
ncbi:MAG: hypothetical protein LBV79_03525 [Candidatus Adiutrix sp.]|jgi:hypothetical protein|nr:hypothetical protein [Candidatus Adiutrix sp.]